MNEQSLTERPKLKSARVSMAAIFDEAEDEGRIDDW
jgi:hypothetical protein